MEGRSRSTFKSGGPDVVMAAGKASVRAVIVAIGAARLDDSHSNPYRLSLNELRG